MRRRRGWLAAALAALATAAPAQASCRLALVLAIDVSASVDEGEYALQTGGIASALAAPALEAALLADPARPVWLAVFEWSSPVGQTLILDWTPLDSPGAIRSAAARVAGHVRTTRPGRTAVGAAMRYAAELVARGPACTAATIDISGDGANNIGPPPRFVRDDPALARVTVNALTIGDKLPQDLEAFAPHKGRLPDWFRSSVIRGPGAFVIEARSFDDYAEAMREKLLREVGGLMLSEAGR